MRSDLTYPQRARGPGEPHHRLEIHAGGDKRGERGDRLRGRAAELRGGMSPSGGGDGDLLRGEHAQDRDARGGGRAQQFLVLSAAGLVEDHPAQVVPGSQVAKPCSRAAADAPLP